MTESKNKKTTEEIAALKDQLAVYENNWKRALADYQNLQKRSEQERISMLEFATFGIIGRLMGILDNLEMLHIHNGDKALEMIIKEFKSILETEGVRELSVVGELFDHATMDALETLDVENQQDDSRVLEVLRKGYMFKDKLLRPALVKVGKFKV
jgi:molecular chaperone GrpE